MKIRYFETRNDANYNNSHAVVNEQVEFFAFPFAPYSGRVGNRSATVDKGLFNKWYVCIYDCQPDGSSNIIARATFDNKDEAFAYAYTSIIDGDTIYIQE